MTPEQQRITIAEVCGWKVEQLASGWLWTHPNYGPRLNTGCPDYPSDLNAMHEAEKGLDEKQWLQYVVQLLTLTLRKTPNARFAEIHATAAERAEAFLRTLNLWTTE